jgi:hypothetical protein
VTPISPGKEWSLHGGIAKDTHFGFLTENRLEVDDRGTNFFVGCAPPLKCGTATFYSGTYKDSTGTLLDGSNSYRLHGPPNVPVNQFWAITVYDSDTQAFIRESARQSIDLYDIGGSIEVTVKNRADADTLTAVRTHLRTIADQFARGEFDKPFQTHGEIPPGVAAMQANAAAIAFRHQQPADGAAVRIETHDGELVQAVHAFLRYQIEEHRTGDPLAVQALNPLRRGPRGARIRSQRGAVSLTATRNVRLARCSPAARAAKLRHVPVGDAAPQPFHRAVLKSREPPVAEDDLRHVDHEHEQHLLRARHAPIAHRVAVKKRRADQ